MRTLALAFLAAVGVSTVPALAGDLFPPSPSNPLAPWVRGAPGTTFNEWTFTTPTQSPEFSHSNPATAPGHISNPDGSTWFPPGSVGSWNGNGVWSIPAGGFIDFLLPNFGPSSGPKYVYLQIKFAGALPGWGVTDPAGMPGTHWPGEPVVTPSPIGGGISQWSDSLMFPYNPAFEVVHIFNPSAQDKCYLTQVVLDTICTPAPGTAALLALGGLVATRRRR